MNDTAQPKSTGEGSRHHLTVLFADLCDSTRLAETIDAEVLAGVLGALRDAAHVAVSRHGGIVVRVQGDGALAVFGYPGAGEQDARRAADAALDLRAALAAIAVPGLTAGAAPLQLRAGIHSGLVFIVDGDIERGRFDLVGPIPHTAARLCALAREGEICVSERALGPAMSFFDVGDTEIHTVKGVADPVRVRRIRGRATVQRRYDATARRGLATFTGRGSALQWLAEQWQHSRLGAPRCVLVVGQPGVGKTRLIEEFTQSAALEAALRLHGYCESYPIAEPLQPFLQLLRQAFGEEAAAPAARLLAAAGADPASVANAQTWPKVIAAWLGRQAQQRPLLIALDDWQWADDASRQTLDLVLALPWPLLVLVASRSAAAAGLETRVPAAIELPPLAGADSRELATYWLPRMDPFVLDEIHLYSGGIPLFVEELCHEVAAGGRLPQGGTAWLNTLIESRMRRLSAPTASLLRIAAVLGNVFPAWLLLRLAGCTDDDSRLHALREHDFLFATDQPGLMRFKHGITRDAIYATVGLVERRQLHDEVARQLGETQGDEGQSALVEALAYHHGAAGNSALAAGFAERAGDKAMAANALDSARAQYTAALRELDLLPALSTDQTRGWCRVAQKLGMACVFDPISIPDRERLLRRAVALADSLGDTNVQARAEYWLGYSLYAVGRARRGAAHCQRALALAQSSGDEPLAAQVRATLGQTFTSLARYDEALPLLDEAIDSKRRRAGSGGSTAIGSAYALASKGLLLTDRGRFADADDCFAQARLLLGASAHPVAGSVCGLMSIALLWQGRWDEAIDVGDQGARVADRSRSRQLLAMGRAIAGFGRWARDRDPAGLRAVQESVDWIETRGGYFMVSLLYGWLMEAAAERGDEAAARRDAARLMLRARDGDRIGEAMGCRALARVAHRKGQGAAALRWLQRAEASARFRQAPHEEAHNLRCRALIGAAQHSAPDPLADAARLYASLGLGAFGAGPPVPSPTTAPPRSSPSAP